MLLRTLVSALILVEFAMQNAPAAESQDSVTIQVDASKKLEELRPIWRFFGADEPNYACMKDGRKLLGELGSLSPGNVFFRTHNLLCTGDGSAALKWGSTNAYTEDAAGRAVYDWTIVDRIFDTYLKSGVRPYVQVGFMPEALSTKPQPYQHHWRPGDKYATIVGGWAFPPKDYDKWRELVRQWVLHCIDRYSKAEVEKWYWELWNEPNIIYWQGTPQEFHKLYDYTVDGVRAALPTARVGGAHVAGGGSEGGIKFQREFFEHCLRGTNYATGKVGTPIDFVAFHAKGAPKVVDGRVQMGISNQLRDIDGGFRTIATFPELKSKPIIIGESDPDGCAACSAEFYPQNAYRNGALYASYTAAAFARKHDLAARHGVNFEGALTWAFEFEDQPYFAGFRVLSTNGIALPVLNVFRMMSMMTGQRIAAESSAAVPLDTMLRDGVRESADISAIASMDDRKLCVMIWNYHDDDIAAPPADVLVSIKGLPAEGVQLTRYLIDTDHANAFELWKKQGSPQKPSAEQLAQLIETSLLKPHGPPQAIERNEEAFILKFSLQRQGVSLLVLSR